MIRSWKNIAYYRQTVRQIPLNILQHAPKFMGNDKHKSRYFLTSSILGSQPSKLVLLLAYWLAAITFLKNIIVSWYFSMANYTQKSIDLEVKFGKSRKTRILVLYSYFIKGVMVPEDRRRELASIRTLLDFGFFYFFDCLYNCKFSLGFPIFIPFVMTDFASHFQVGPFPLLLSFSF